MGKIQETGSDGIKRSVDHALGLDQGEEAELSQSQLASLFGFDTHPVLILKTKFENVTQLDRDSYFALYETLNYVKEEAEKRNVPVALAILPGSVEVVIAFLVIVSHNPAVAAAVGGLVSAIVSRFKRRGLVKQVIKSREIAFSQVQEVLRQRGTEIKNVDSEIPLGSYGYQMMVTDAADKHHVFTVAHSCTFTETSLG